MGKLVVMKFGGSNLNTAKDFAHIAGIIKKKRADGKEKTIAIVSAPFGVTDRLIEAAKNALKSESAATEFGAFIGKRVSDLAGGLKEAKIKIATEKELEKHIQILKKTLIGVHYVQELTPRTYDFIQSYGERLSAALLESYLRDIHVNARGLDGGQAGILTNGVFGNAQPLMKETRKKAANAILPLVEKNAVVVTGFFGVDAKGEVTAFSRGGSDFSASIIAHCVDADVLEIWKDVDGFMSADPKTMPKARLIPELSYDEAAELGYGGAKIIHPSALWPIKEKHIPAIVRNVFKPESMVGTVISGKAKKHAHVIKAVTFKKAQALVTVKGLKSFDTPGAASAIFDRLTENKINIDFISTSNVNISFSIGQKDAEKTRHALGRHLTDVFEKLMIDEKVAVVSVVGEGLKEEKGISGRLFSCLGDNAVNVKSISQGGSEINISFVIDEKDLSVGVKAIHQQFIE